MFNLEYFFGTTIEKVDDIIANMDKHVHEFSVPKKSGGVRKIIAPSDELKEVLTTLNERFLVKYKAHNACYGFAKGKSVRDNAGQHTNCGAMLNVDIKDFFQSITAEHLKNILFGCKNLCEKCSHKGDKCSISLYENINLHKASQHHQRYRTSC